MGRVKEGGREWEEDEKDEGWKKERKTGREEGRGCGNWEMREEWKEAGKKRRR